MIRPELHAFKWSPKTKSKEDLELVKFLEQLVKEHKITKTQLTREALKHYLRILTENGLISEDLNKYSKENKK